MRVYRSRPLNTTTASILDARIANWDRKVKMAEKDDAKHSYRLVKDGKDFHVRVQRPVRSRV